MPQPSSSDRGFTVTIDPGKTANFYRELRAFDPKLTTALRASIRNAGYLARDAVIQALKQASPTGKPFNEESMRAALAAATKVTISFAQKSAGAKIRTGQELLAGGHQGFAFVYNMTTFRHPVFENADQQIARHSEANLRRTSIQKMGRDHTLAAWVTQKGDPYFAASINKIISTTIKAEVESAFDVAAKASGIASPF